MGKARLAPLLLAACGPTVEIDREVTLPWDSGEEPRDTCDLEAPAAGTVTHDPEHGTEKHTPIADPWNTEVAWEVSGVYFGQAVAGFLDRPAVVLPAGFYGEGSVLLALDGATGEELWRWGPTTAANRYAPAIQDLDGDGLGEVLAFDEYNYPVAIGPTGELRWRQERAWTSITDYLDVLPVHADGAWSIFASNLWLDGSGELIAFFYEDEDSTLYERGARPLVADLERDGDLSLLLADRGFDIWDASVLFDWVPGVDTYATPYAAVFDLDDDTLADVLGVAGGLLFHTDPVGLQTTVVSAFTVPAGPPCAADFDGDGAPELGLADDRVAVLDTDFTELWALPLEVYPEQPAHCTAADLDGDGAAELLHASVEGTRIFAGATGEVLWQGERLDAAYTTAQPVVADVDGDGRAELVEVGVSEDRERAWVRVHRHAGGGWAETGDAPCTQPPACGDTTWWTEHNGFRSQPTALPEDHVEWIPVPAWEIEAQEACQEGCHGTAALQVTARIANRGATGGAVILELVGAVGTGMDAVRVELDEGTSAGVLLETFRDAVGGDEVTIRALHEGSEPVEVTLDLDPC